MRHGEDGQLRLLDTPKGPIYYILVRKPVKNLNLRISRSGQVTLSVPTGLSVQRAETFLREKSGWIVSNLAHLKENGLEPLPKPAPEETARLLAQALERVYPLVEPFGVAYPRLKLRALKSQWGNCHWSQGYITLNTALARCPEELRDYVALHELVHFIHHDHGAGFYSVMDSLMPNWRARRKELRRWGGALEGQ